MNDLVPPFDFQRVIIEPWTGAFEISIWVVAMGALVGIACGLIGNYLLLRRMTLVGDAISHSIVFGLVVAFLVFNTRGTIAMFGGAIFAGILTVGMIEAIHRLTRVKVDAAICIAFTTLFALGVTLAAAFSGGSVEIDAECILYGEIAFVPLEPPVMLGDVQLGPPSVLRMAGVTLALIIAIGIFYKELLLTSFDAALARAMGLRAGAWHYALMTALSLVVVSAFEAVGAILAVALLVVPPMFAAQLSDKLPVRFVWTAIHALLSAVIGYHLAVWLDCATAGAMVVAGSGLFLLAWAWTAMASTIRRRGARAIREIATATATLVLLVGCSRPDEQAIQLVRENLLATAKGDVSAVDATLHPDSPVRESVLQGIEALQDYPIHVEIEKLTWRGRTDAEAQIEVLQVARGQSDGIKFRNHRARGRYTVRKDADRWKVWNIEILAVEYLDQ